jgi:hypothetical protein
VPGERAAGIVVRVLARALAFLWPDRWTRTRRGLVLCIVATCALAGSLAGLLAGVILTVTVH